MSHNTKPLTHQFSDVRNATVDGGANSLRTGNPTSSDQWQRRCGPAASRATANGDVCRLFGIN